MSFCFYFNIKKEPQQSIQQSESILSSDKSSYLGETNPSVVSDDLYDDNGNIHYSLQLKALFSDKVYIFMFLSTGLMTGVLGGIGNAINEIVTLWGFP